MSRYNHFLPRSYDLLLLECPSWYLCNLTSPVRTLISWGWGRERWILLWSLSWNECHIFKLYPLHDIASIRLSYCHSPSWCHGMMLTIRVCLIHGCGLRGMRCVYWSSKLNDFLSYYLPRIVLIINGRLIIARDFRFWGVPDCLTGDHSTLYPLCSKHRTGSLLLRIFNLIRVRRCHDKCVL